MIRLILILFTLSGFSTQLNKEEFQFCVMSKGRKSIQNPDKRVRLVNGKNR